MLFAGSRDVRFVSHGWPVAARGAGHPDTSEEIGLELAVDALALDERTREHEVFPWVEVACDVQRNLEPERVGRDLGPVREERRAADVHESADIDASGRGVDVVGGPPFDPV